MVIGPDNYADPQQLALLAGEAAVIARQERHVPPWVMAAQEGGEFNAFPTCRRATAAVRPARRADAAARRPSRPAARCGRSA